MLTSPGARRGSGSPRSAHGVEIPFVFDALGLGTEPLLGRDPPAALSAPCTAPGGFRRRRRLPPAQRRPHPQAHDALRTDIGDRGRSSGRRARPVEGRALATTGTRQELREAIDPEGRARRPDRPTGRALSNAGRRTPCSTRLALQCGPPQGPLRVGRGSWRCPDRTSEGMLGSGVCIDCPARPSAGGGAGSANGATMDSAGGRI
jgi:hypothetical protein